MFAVNITVDYNVLSHLQKNLYLLFIAFKLAMNSLITVSFVRQVRTDMKDNLFTSTCISKQASNRTYASHHLRHIRHCYSKVLCASGKKRKKTLM